MIADILILIGGGSLLALMFIIQNAFSKPVYNKMSNVWEDDPVGRKFHNAIIISMVILAFLMGLVL
jgi:hypothetical protein